MSSQQVVLIRLNHDYMPLTVMRPPIKNAEATGVLNMAKYGSIVKIPASRISFFLKLWFQGLI